jgi:hypothetical protein
MMWTLVWQIKHYVYTVWMIGELSTIMIRKGGYNMACLPQSNFKIGSLHWYIAFDKARLDWFAQHKRSVAPPRCSSSHCRSLRCFTTRSMGWWVLYTSHGTRGKYNISVCWNCCCGRACVLKEFEKVFKSKVEHYIDFNFSIIPSVFGACSLPYRDDHDKFIRWSQWVQIFSQI